MATPICVETPKSRSFSKAVIGGPMTREFTVLHQSDPAAAITLVEAQAAVSYQGRERKRIELECLCEDIWLARVTYGSAASDGALSPDVFACRITGSNAHITQSFATEGRVGTGPDTATGTNLAVDGTNPLLVTPDTWTPAAEDVGRLISVSGVGFATGYYTITAAGGGQWTLDAAPAAVGTAGGSWRLLSLEGAPDNKGAIGQDKDSLQGCDIVIPGGEFSLNATYGTMSLATYRTWKSYVGMVNDREWKGFSRGEVMYLGAEPNSPEGTLVNGQAMRWWGFAHQFRDDTGRANVRVGEIVVPWVPPHAYVWARYEQKDAAGRMVSRPVGVYVERVHRGYFDFSVLAIP